MKKILFSLFLTAISLSLFFPGSALAGVWKKEFPITQDELPQYRSYITVAPDDTVYVLWPDWTDWENTKVNLIQSPDKGRTWSDPSVIFEGLAYENMDILAHEDALHLLLVVFQEDNQGEYKELYHSKSLDRGETFSLPERIGKRSNIEQIDFFSGFGLLFIYARNYTNKIPVDFLYVSSTGGDIWQEKPLLPGTVVQNPDFAVRDSVIHVAFGGDLSKTGISYSQSGDAGTTWSEPVSVSQNEGKYSQLPEIVLDESAIHVAWEDNRSGYFNIMYARSMDEGLTWSANKRLNDTFYGARVKLLADEEGLHAVWSQYHGDNGWPSSWGSADYGIIWYKSSRDSGLTWTDEGRVSQNRSIPCIDLPSKGANYVRLEAYRVGFCALWQDKRDGNVDLYMRNCFFFLPLEVDAGELSGATGGIVNFALAAGKENANLQYILLGSISGTNPGILLPGGGTLPLKRDSFMNIILSAVNTPVFWNFKGRLDAAGNATARLNTLGPIPVQYAGTNMHFAYAVNNVPWGLASKAVKIEIKP